MANYNFYTLSASSDINNIRYVGVTTKSVIERFYGHKYCAMHPEKRGLPVHKWMYSHYEKGEDIIVTQIDSCDESEWENREKYWIDFYKKGGCLLTNISEGGKGIITKEMRSKSSIERSVNKHKKSIIALNKDGSFYKKYNSIKDATLDLNLKSYSSISNVLNKRSKSASGFLWIFEDEYDSNKNYSYEIINKGNTVYEFDIDGILLNEYPSKSYFDKIKGWSANGIKYAIQDKKIYHDHYWSLSNKINLEEYEPYFYYKEVDKNNNIVELYRTQSEICKKYNLNPSVLCIKIKNKKELSNGNFICKL